MATPDGAIGPDGLPQAQALQLQQVSAITRSQQLLTASSSFSVQQQQPALSPIVDLTIALITSLPIPAKSMPVRLTRRNQCSDLRNNMNQPAFGGIGGTSMPISGNNLFASSSSSSPLASNTLIQLTVSAFVTLLIFSLTTRLQRRVTLFNLLWASITYKSKHLNTLKTAKHWSFLSWRVKGRKHTSLLNI